MSSFIPGLSACDEDGLEIKAADLVSEQGAT